MLASLFLAFAPALTTPGASQEAPTPGSFPESTALAEGVSPASLGALDELVRELVEEGEIVGAELLVLKNGRSILHEGYGFADREEDVPMEPGRVFCVRSMTKPVIAAAVLMLVDDKVIALDDHVADHLPYFDVEGRRDITVEHLLTHTSGLPMSYLIGQDLYGLDGIGAVATLGTDRPLEARPGERFRYSDQGTDTLTALIEAVSGKSAAAFVEERVLGPLAMGESATVMTEDHPLRDRALPKYAGNPGHWARFWGPQDRALFPFFLGSQGMYSTLEDYARFMEFWRRKGRGPDGRLLRSRYARKTLEPKGSPMGAPTGFPGLRVDYGYLMQLWTGPAEEGSKDEREVVAFGHTGSDGTHAWVFPEQKAMVLYFTQSRGTMTGLRVEEALGQLFLGAPFDPNEAAPPLEPYLGYYFEGEGDLYRAIVMDGEDLALEIMGQGVVPLSYAGGDRWKLRPNPSMVLEFQRTDTGEVTGYTIGDHVEYRFEPAADLPSVEEIAELVAETHRIDLLENLGPLRLTGQVEMPKLGLNGSVETLLAPGGRFRFDSVMETEFERLAFDGEQVRTVHSRKELAVVDGPAGELLRVNTVLARLGDWSQWYGELEVIQRLEKSGREVVLVRVGDTSAPGRSLYVDVESGHVLREDGLTHVDSLGRIGQRITMGDYRDVEGMGLPFRMELGLANPMIGMVITTYDGFEFESDLPAGTFELRDE